MVREKERGTVEQLLVSPLIAFADHVAQSAVDDGGDSLRHGGRACSEIMQPVFGVPIKGSIGLFFVLTALFVFTTAGMGLAAATLARNQAQVGMMTLLVVAPMLLLSGLMAPMEAMPEWVASPHGAVASALFHRDHARHSLEGGWLERPVGLSARDGVAWGGDVRLRHVAVPETV